MSSSPLWGLFFTAPPDHTTCMCQEIHPGGAYSLEADPPQHQPRPFVLAGDRTVSSFSFVGAASAKQSFVRMTPDVKENFGSLFSRLSGRFSDGATRTCAICCFFVVSLCSVGRRADVGGDGGDSADIGVVQAGVCVLIVATMSVPLWLLLSDFVEWCGMPASKPLRFNDDRSTTTPSLPSSKRPAYCVPSTIERHPFLYVLFVRRTSRWAIFSGYDVSRERECRKVPRQISCCHSRQPGHDSENRYVEEVAVAAIAGAVVVVVVLVVGGGGVTSVCGILIFSRNLPPP